MYAGSERVASEDRIALLMPKAFPSSKSHADRYELIELSELDRNGNDPKRVRGVALAGHMVFDGPVMDRFPALEIIARFGVGYDTVDIAAASERGIVVTNTPDVLSDEVADLALGLLIATVRRIPQAERYLRAGSWQQGPFPLTASLRGRRVGVFGLGRIGRAFAERVAAMGLDVAYTSRTRKPDAPWTYFADHLELAAHADVLVVVVPGGADTDGLIDERALAALGPDGVLINVARGSVVDEAALVAALRTGTIAAAGLDVFAREPDVPAELLALDNVVLLPHVGSGTTTTRRAMGDLVFSNLNSWFAGTGPVTPVPG